MKNNTFNDQNCYCPHCEAELKNGCLSPEFCTPCYINRKNNGIKMCPVCKSEYAYEEYSECPVCSVQKKDSVKGKVRVIENCNLHGKWFNKVDIMR